MGALRPRGRPRHLFGVAFAVALLAPAWGETQPCPAAAPAAAPASGAAPAPGVAPASNTTPAPAPAPAPTPTAVAAPAAQPPPAAGDARLPADGVCTYRTYSWDTKLRRAVGHRTVRKRRSELAADEVAPDDPSCSVCSEDQAEVSVPGLRPFLLCRTWAPRVQAALRAIQASGTFRIERVSAYRVGRTRGPLVGGRRTVFSNHSYGTAIDLNAHHNGLYRRCRLAGPPAQASDLRACRLGIGGAWDPRRRPRTTVTADGVAYRELTRFWRWGGELPGQLKDLMHFSVTGE